MNHGRRQQQPPSPAAGRRETNGSEEAVRGSKRSDGQDKRSSPLNTIDADSPPPSPSPRSSSAASGRASSSSPPSRPRSSSILGPREATDRTARSHPLPRLVAFAHARRHRPGEGSAFLCDGPQVCFRLLCPSRLPPPSHNAAQRALRTEIEGAKAVPSWPAMWTCLFSRPANDGGLCSAPTRERAPTLGRLAFRWP